MSCHARYDDRWYNVCLHNVLMHRYRSEVDVHTWVKCDLLTVSKIVITQWNAFQSIMSSCKWTRSLSDSNRGHCDRCFKWFHNNRDPSSARWVSDYNSYPSRICHNYDTTIFMLLQNMYVRLSSCMHVCVCKSERVIWSYNVDKNQNCLDCHQKDHTYTPKPIVIHCVHRNKLVWKVLVFGE